MSTLTEEQIKEKCLNNLRIIRNRILNSTDKYVTPDYPHKNPEIRTAWKIYRQALRDLTTTVIQQNIVLDADLTNVVWPTPPE